MNFRKQFIFLLALILLIPLFCFTASAAEEPEFRYELTVDGKDTVEVEPGDIITVTLHLYRTDANADYTMYAMQDEIRYDSTFFELVEDSPQAFSGVRYMDIGVAQDRREFYMSYLSFAGGDKWQQKTRIGTFQLRVIATSGTTTLSNEDCRVSLPDGSGSYKCEANVLTVVLSTECTIKFESNGGTHVDPITALYGEKIAKPKDPTREGKRFLGWYRDIHLTDEWNFETDTVTGNMTLYAKWADGDPVIVEPQEKLHCFICGRECSGILGIPICWVCLLIILGILYFAFRWLRMLKEDQAEKKRRNKQAKQTDDKKE